MATFTKIEDKVPYTIEEANQIPRGRVFPSPINWNDQIFYQILPDRFSDGHESGRPLFDYFNNSSQFKTMDRKAWMNAGNRFVGGTIMGIQTKLDYLQNLGATALWINPMWKQRADLQTYHGYGIQNFLDIDPRFGTRQDLRNLIDSAHDRNMYVILDVIYNHTGNNWFYRDENTGEPQQSMPYRTCPIYPFHGWRSGSGVSISRPLIPEDGVWPEEFQNIDLYSRVGQISNWEAAPWEDPMNPNLEFRRGDFYELKKLHHEDERVVRILAQIFRYWIALTDCDGFRVDAIKHVSVEVSHRLCTAIHGYALSIGKENFFLVGEIMSSLIAPAYIDIFGGNLDAVLGIVDYPNRLTGFVKGELDPKDFFSMYDERTLQGMVRQIGRYIVHVLDDHDMCSRKPRKRFAAHGHMPIIWLQTANAISVLLTSPGIPSIYYGTEQAFDGTEERHDFEIDPQKKGLDRYIRETMFGGAFGAFETENCHFFNPNHPTYVRISAIALLRNREDMIGKTLRRGHFYARDTSCLSQPFSIPKRGELAAWSMVLYETEVLMALNTNSAEERGADVTVDAYLHPEGSAMTYLYRGNWSPQELSQPPEDQKAVVRWQPDGRATVHIDLPPACMAILA